MSKEPTVKVTATINAKEVFENPVESVSITKGDIKIELTGEELDEVTATLNGKRKRWDLFEKDGDPYNPSKTIVSNEK